MVADAAVAAIVKKRLLSILGGAHGCHQCKGSIEHERPCAFIERRLDAFRGSTCKDERSGACRILASAGGVEALHI